MIKLDFTKCLASQDMINIIMKDKNLSDKEAIEFSINKHIYQKIIELGYASIAFDLWGHDDPERKWYRLSNPVIELDLSEEKKKLIYNIAKRENVTIEIAVGYFMIFVMDSLGYHI